MTKKPPNATSIDMLKHNIISHSWQRSSGYNVSNQRIVDNDILPPSRLRERCQSQDYLVHMAKTVMPDIYAMLKGLNYSILLCDSEGYILRSLGDPPFLNKSQKVFLSPGANWSEQRKGTNAIGTALAEQAPVEVWGTDHYVRENHFLACWAAPIRGNDGRILAVLDISGEADERYKDRRIMQLALLGSRMLEQGLRLFELQQVMGQLRNGIALAAEMVGKGQIVIDQQGYISEIAHPDLTIHDYRAGELIGRPLVEALNFNKVFSLKPGNSPGKMPPVISRNAEPIALPGKHPSLPSEAASRVLEQAARSARTDSSVLITGESGTGKEVIGRYIHECSSRRTGPFIAFSCSALPDSLIESELFGYAHGAFTGARRGGQAGKFELANGGTIFLDEIGDMPLARQPVLLRVLQEREIWRIGEARPRKVDVRVIAASNKDIQDMVNRGQFRLDLFYRLKIITIELPPLRERMEDILELVPLFVRKACKAMERSPVAVAGEVYDLLMGYAWPGNIRQLENCVESMVAMSSGSLLTADDVPADIKAGLPVPSGSQEPFLRQQMRLSIIRALGQSKWKVAPAARLLGIGRNTLYRKMREFGIRHPS
jgi:transcriptional regulator of acetoin/glycerol metabolism